MTARRGPDMGGERPRLTLLRPDGLADTLSDGDITRENIFDERDVQVEDAEEEHEVFNIEVDSSQAEELNENDIENAFESAKAISSDSLRAYLNETSKYKLLDAAEEVELAKKIEAGLFAADLLETGQDLKDAAREELEAVAAEGVRAKETFINANLRLVVAHAVRINRARKTRTMDLLDLIQAGNEGLFPAVEKFDYTKGFKFSTYASRWIKERIQRGIEWSDDISRRPNHIHDRIKKIKEAREDFLRTRGREATTQELSKALEFDVMKFENTLRPTSDMGSLNQLLEESGTVELGDIAEEDEDTRAANWDKVEERYIAAQTRQLLGQVGLSDPERFIIFRRHFYTSRKQPLLREVGEELVEIVPGRTKPYSLERVRQLEKAATGKIRKHEGLRALARRRGFFRGNAKNAA